jgi:hypothetical protein
VRVGVALAFRMDPRDLDTLPPSVYMTMMHAAYPRKD